MSILVRLLCPVLTALACAAPAGAQTPWEWPVPAPRAIVRGFDNPPQNWLPGHRGVDLGTVSGATVRAAGAGRVVFAGNVGGKPVVSIEHRDGLRTTYEPVTATVETGTVVEPGQPIGVVVAGHPECAATACLHWGLRRGDDYLDPLQLVRPRQIRLKPL
ncbi:murein hydrolase activator EnvC family protein [Smaragdicoccus niigatensis]|uniref:murein hydrolase activator EnvC family protein n=1 Tax=Smaragdicoccus niigatensis TaxID=359359 RepID=UPI00037B7DFC|nr:M23 family metallopeptidase [Smaragdicoccus niigatensis]